MEDNNNEILVEVSSDLKEIIPGFLERRRDDIEIIKDSLVKSDFETIRTLGHRLKGNAGGYGFHDLGIIGGDIEKASENQNAQDIKMLLQKLVDYVSNVKVVYI